MSVDIDFSALLPLSSPLPFLREVLFSFSLLRNFLPGDVSSPTTHLKIAPSPSTQLKFVFYAAYLYAHHFGAYLPRGHADPSLFNWKNSFGFLTSLHSISHHPLCHFLSDPPPSFPSSRCFDDSLLLIHLHSHVPLNKQLKVYLISSSLYSQQLMAALLYPPNNTRTCEGRPAVPCYAS